MTGGKLIAVALWPTLVAAPALARDGVVVPVATAAIPADGRAMLMAEAHVGTGDRLEEDRGHPAMPSRDAGTAGQRQLSRLTVIEPATSAKSHALPAIPEPPLDWHIVPDRPQKSRIDATPVDRMSLEGSADYRRRRNIGLDARLELKIDGREESAMVSLAGRLARAIQSLEHR